MSIRAHHVDTYGGWKRASDILQFELQVILRCPKWVLGIELQCSPRAASPLNHWAVSPAPSSCFLETRSQVSLQLTT